MRLRMRIFGNHEDSLKFGLSFFLVLGAVLGSLFCNGMDDEMKRELYVAEQSLVSHADLARVDFGELCFQILPRRLWQLAVMLLVSTTTFSYIWAMALVCYLGFSSAVMVSSLTMEAGIAGLWRYLLLIFPQCLVYIPVLYLLLWWMPIRKKRLTVLSSLALLFLVLLGVCAEVFLNPWLLILL